MFRDRELSPVPTGGSGALGPPIPDPIFSDDDDEEEDDDADDGGGDGDDDDGGDGDEDDDDDDVADDGAIGLTEDEFIQVLQAQQHLQNTCAK